MPGALTAGRLTFGLIALSMVNASDGLPREDLVKVEIRGVVTPVSGFSSPILILEAPDREEALFIGIGTFEAEAIRLGLERRSTPRPMTHDLLQSVLKTIGAELSRVVVTELRENTYYAILDLEQAGERFRLDSRPSDAVALAIRDGAPVYVSVQVFRQNSEQVPSEEREGVKREALRWLGPGEGRTASLVEAQAWLARR